MKKEYEENKPIKKIETSSNVQLLTTADYCAALCLVSLKYTKLDKKRAATLDGLRREDVRRIKSKGKQEEEPNSVILGRNRIVEPNPSPDIVTIPIEALAGLVGQCSRPCEKRLTETDLKDSQLRLSLNKDHVQKSMIPLLREDEDVIGGIPVNVYDWEGKKYSMMFKFWSSKMYVLNGTEWKTFYKEHRLEKDDDIVNVWMFRHRQTQDLCFAITRRKSPMTEPKQLNGRKRKQFSNSTITDQL